MKRKRKEKRMHDQRSKFLAEYLAVRNLVIRRWTTAIGDAADACVGCPSCWCCYQMPLSHLMEGFAVASWLEERGRLDAELPAITAQGVIQHELVQESFGSFTAALAITRSRLDKEAEEAAMERARAEAEGFALKWYERDEACCFLKNGRCSIYEVRPVMCSSYFVQTRCGSKPSYSQSVPVVNNMEVVAAVMKLSDMAISDMMDDRIEVAPVPFTYGIAVGARMLRGQEVGVVELRRAHG